MRDTRRRSLALPAAALVALASVACGGPGTGADRRDGSSLTVLYDADERIFGPYWSVDAWFLMFLPLMGNGERGEYVPRLARSWEHSADFRAWTFHLRPGVRWHDGVPVTAHDVKFSIELAAHPDVLFDNPWHDLDSTSVADDTTLTLFYSRPKDARNTWMVYWPRHHLEGLDPAGFYDWDFWKQPVGNGPYRHVRHMPQTMVELEANPDFFAGKPAIERLTLKFGGALGIPELLSGEVDVLSSVNMAEIPKLVANPRFEIHYYLSPEVPWLQAIFWNHEHRTLGSPRVRRALTMAIDRAELLRVLNLPPELPLTDVPFTRRQFRERAIPAILPHDPSGARGLLDEAGWPVGQGSIRERNGTPLRFTAILVGDGAEEQAAVYVQSALREVGVDLQIQTMDRSLFMSRVAAGDYDAAFVPFYNQIEGHLNLLAGGSPYDQRGPDRAGLPGYDNPEVTRLLRSALETIDPFKVDSIYREVWPLIQAELPITFLYPQVQTYVVHRRLRGLKSPERGDPILFMERLWIDDGP